MAGCCRGKVGSTKDQSADEKKPQKVQHVMDEKEENMDKKAEQVQYCKDKKEGDTDVIKENTDNKVEKIRKMISEVLGTAENDCKKFFVKITKYLKENRDNLVREIIDNYPINDDGLNQKKETDTQNTTPEDIDKKKFDDALRLQTELVYKLVGHYFEIPEVSAEKAEMHHFFIWSLLAEGSTVCVTMDNKVNKVKINPTTNKQTQTSTADKSTGEGKPTPTAVRPTGNRKPTSTAMRQTGNKKPTSTAMRQTGKKPTPPAVKATGNSKPRPPAVKPKGKETQTSTVEKSNDETSTVKENQTSPDEKSTVKIKEKQSIAMEILGIYESRKNRIFAALFAAALLKALSKESSDEKTELRESSDAFSQRAIAEIKEMYTNDGESKSRTYIANTKWPNLITMGRITILDFAVKSKNLDFLNQPVCTTVLNERWMGNIAGKNTIKWLLFCLFLVPICSPIWLVRYRQKSWEIQADIDARNSKEKAENTEKDEEFQWRDRDKCKRFQYFFEAPVIRFLMNGITYIMFLGYFSSVLLIQYSFEPTNDDLILLIFAGVIAAEEILPRVKNVIDRMLNKKDKEHGVECSSSLRMHVRSKRISSWLSSPSGIWNTLNIVSTILFIVGYILKLIDIDASRVVMAVDLILLYIRSLQVFAIHKRLGPKILMIGHMFKDLFYFILILMVFVVSYGMASHSLMYPNSQLNTQFVLNLLKRAYWNIYGELLIEELEQKEPDCTFDANLYNNDVLPRCPTAFSTVWIPVLMGFYIMVANILLLNLLIAIFSSTYEKIEQNNEKLWNYHRIYLIKRYEKQTWFILPLSTFYYFGLIFTAKCRKKMADAKKENKEKTKSNGVTLASDKR